MTAKAAFAAECSCTYAVVHWEIRNLAPSAKGLLVLLQDAFALNKGKDGDAIAINNAKASGRQCSCSSVHCGTKCAQLHCKHVESCTASMSRAALPVLLTFSTSCVHSLLNFAGDPRQV